MIASRLFLSLALLFLPAIHISAQAQESENKVDYPIDAVRYITWWFHSATGYHPAIWLVVENTSGQDLSGVLIRFQARFTNLRNGYVNVARDELRQEFRVNEQVRVLLKGPKAYELPIDQNLWPKMECKVMCRVGDVEDEGTQSLLVTKMNSVTMSVEEAQTRLFKQPSLRSLKTAINQRQNKVSQEKPLVAVADSLSSPKQTVEQFLSGKTLPGLGDDFYDFECKYGRPLEYDASNPKWTWVSYTNRDPRFVITVGSRGQTGKADMVVATVPVSLVKGEGELVNFVRSISGRFKADQPSKPERSVRYLPSGRLEYSTLSTQNYRGAFFIPGESSQGGKAYNLVVTRMPGNILNILRQEARNAKLLKFLIPVIGDGPA